ncbi:MAG: hypothetical protein AAB288_04830 [Acidobacteriota bacterium]
MDKLADFIEEQERREEINEVLTRYPVPTKHQDLQRANERQMARHVSIMVAIGVGLMALVWLILG